MKLVIFDMDGVLVDSELISCRETAAVLTEAGLPIDTEEMVAKFIGTSSRDIIRTVAGRYGKEPPLGLIPVMRARALAAFETELSAVPNIAEALDAINGTPACVASSSDPERISRALELAGLHDRLAPHFFSSTMVEHGKPAPDIFLHAAREMGVDPADAVVVEDSVAGVTAGRAAGMTVVGFLGGCHVVPESHGQVLTSVGADHLAGDAKALAAWFSDRHYSA